MSQHIKVMLVEDTRDYRLVIEHALEVEPDIELISQFGTPEIALRSLEDSHTRQLPDLILLDLRLPGMDGLEALPWFRQAIPSAKIVILTQSNEESDILHAIRLGASGYLLKSSSAKQLIEGIRTVINEGATVDSSIARFILDTLQTTIPAQDPEGLLTSRQLEILSLLADGLSKKEISEQLQISYSTVSTHIEHIYQKLEVPNAPAAVSKAYQKGLLKPE